MNKKIIPVSLCIISLLTVNLMAKTTIGIIVNKDLYASIQTTLDQYIEALRVIENKNVWLNTTTFTATNTKVQLKDSLKAHYENDSLEGAILIGDLPIARYKNNSDYGGGAVTFACDLFYMDLNGTWSPADLPTSHTGDKNPEIWISRLTCSVITQNAGTTEANILNKYFPRVLSRMSGSDDMQRKVLIVGQKDIWGGLEGEHTDSTGLDYKKADRTLGTSATTWKNGLIAGQEYGFIYSHSGETFHQISPGYAIAAIYSDKTNCRFYNSYACSNGNYATANMVGAYATEDNGLICIGSTKTGSMCPGSYKPYNRSLGQDKLNFGTAFKVWWKEKGLTNYDYVSWHYGMNLQGVGNLYLQPYAPTKVSSHITQPVSLYLRYDGSRIHFQVPDNGKKESRVTIKLYTTQGRLINTVFDRNVKSGHHFTYIDNHSAGRESPAAGLYVCIMEINGFRKAIHLVIKGE